MPRIDAHLANRIEQLVDEYLSLAQGLTPPVPGRAPERVLLEIDAAVLEGYDLPPRLERSLLDYFNGQGSRRPVSHPFEDYFPSDFRPCLPLARYISKDFELATAEAFRRTPPTDSSDVRRALEAACGIEGQVDP